jgi:hypothetical protein
MSAGRVAGSKRPRLYGTWIEGYEVRVFGVGFLGWGATDAAQLPAGAPMPPEFSDLHKLPLNATCLWHVPLAQGCSLHE